MISRVPLLYFSRGQPGSVDADVALELFAARSPARSTLAAKTIRDMIFINVVRDDAEIALLLYALLDGAHWRIPVGADSPRENVPEDCSIGYWTLVLYDRLAGIWISFGCE